MKRIKILFIMCICFVALCATGCQEKEEEQKEYPILQMMSMGAEPGHMEDIYEQLDRLTEEELGIRVRISFYPWDDEKETAYKLINSNSCDIYVYGSPFGSSELAQRGAFLDMKSYLDTVPELVDYYLEQGVRLEEQENVYSLPRLLSSTGFGFFYREDLRKEWELENVTDFASMELYLYEAKKRYPETAPINDKRFFDSLKALIVGERYHELGYGLGIDRNTLEVVCLLETEEYLDSLKIARKWYQDGIVSEDVLYLQSNNTMSTLEMMKQDRTAVEFCNHFSAVTNNYVLPLYQVNQEWELGWFDFELADNACYDTYSLNDATMGLAIGSNCRYPEQAMLLLEKMHTDLRYYYLLTYGVEGIHYQMTEDGRIGYEGIDSENLYRGQVGLEQDALSLEQSYPDNWDSVYVDTRSRFQEMKAVNGSSQIASFYLDAVKYDQYSEALTVYTNSKTRQLLETGTAKDINDGLKQLIAELEDSGYKEFMEAVCRNWEDFCK